MVTLARLGAALARLVRAEAPPPAPAHAAPAHAAKSLSSAWVALDGLGRTSWAEPRYDRLAAEGHARNAIVHRSVGLISRGLAGVPWLLYRGDQELEDHPLKSLLARPHPGAAGTALFERLAGHILMAGEAYLLALGPEDAPPRELWPLRPDRVRVVTGASGLPLAYAYTAGGRTTEFPVDPATGRCAVMAWRLFDPLDEWRGASPLAAASAAIEQHNAAGAWNQALLRNGARPSGALVYAPKDGPWELAPDQFQRLRETLAADVSGPANAGKPLLLEGGLDWRPMSLTPKDMDFLSAKHAAAREIATALGVPPMLLGVPGDATYANYREARLALWEETILPLLDGLASELNAWLAPRFGAGLRLVPDLDAVSALSPRREAVWARVGGADFLTADEKRAAVGYGPLPQQQAAEKRGWLPLEPVDDGGAPPLDDKAGDHWRFQPRVPAGNPEGGQWIAGSGGGIGDGEDPAAPLDGSGGVGSGSIVNQPAPDQPHPPRTLSDVSPQPLPPGLPVLDRPMTEEERRVGGITVRSPGGQLAENPALTDEVITTVLGRGRRDNREHSVVIDRATGRILEVQSQGRSNEVGMTEPVLRMAERPVNDLIAIHNHPRSRPPSPSDLTVLAQLPGIKRLVVLAHDGGIYSVEMGDHPQAARRLAQDEARSNRSLTAREYDAVGAPEGLRVEEKEWLILHISNQSLHDAGLIRYDYVLPSGYAELVRKNQDFVQAVRRRVTAQLRRPAR